LGGKARRKETALHAEEKEISPSIRGSAKRGGNSPVAHLVKKWKKKENSRGSRRIKKASRQSSSFWREKFL